MAVLRIVPLEENAAETRASARLAIRRTRRGRAPGLRLVGERDRDAGVREPKVTPYISAQVGEQRFAHRRDGDARCQRVERHPRHLDDVRIVEWQARRSAGADAKRMRDDVYVAGNVERFADVRKLVDLDRKAGLLGTLASKGVRQKLSGARTAAGKPPQGLAQIRISRCDQQNRPVALQQSGAEPNFGQPRGVGASTAIRCQCSGSNNRNGRGAVRRKRRGGRTFVAAGVADASGSGARREAGSGARSAARVIGSAFCRFAGRTTGRCPAERT